MNFLPPQKLFTNLLVPITAHAAYDAAQLLLTKREVLDADDLVLGRIKERPDEVIQGLELPGGGVDLDKVEEQLVRQALQRTAGNQTQAAKLLGISFRALRYRIKKLGLE